MKHPISKNSFTVIAYTSTVFEVFSVKHGRGRVLHRSQYSLRAIGADKVVVDDEGQLKCFWASDLLHAGDREEGGIKEEEGLSLSRPSRSNKEDIVIQSQQ